MLKSKKLKRAFSIIMTSVFCMVAFAQTLHADEYALKGTISSALELMEGATSWTTNQTTGNIDIRHESDTSDGAIFTAYKLLNIENKAGVLNVSIPADAQDFWNDYTGKPSATVPDIKEELAGKTPAEQSSDIINRFLAFTGTKPGGKDSSEASGGKTQITTEFGFYAILQTGAPVKGFIASAPVLACLPMQDPTSGTWLSQFTIEPKDDKISVTKKVHASDEIDFKDETITNINDTVTYEIIAELPEYGADIISSGITYTLEDKLPDGVTMKDGTVKIELEEKGTTVFTEDTTLATRTYTPAAAPNPAKITVQFNNYKNDINKKYDKIKITYSADLNKDAVIEGDGNINNVTLTYSSYSNQLATTTADAKVYTLGLDITKVDKDGGAALTGAEFEVHKQSNGLDEAIKFVEITGADGIKRYRVATQAEINNDEVTKVTTIKVTDTDDANKGRFMLDGLNNTTYWFKETKAPTDYNRPADLFDIEVKPTAYTDAENHGDYNGTGTELDFDDNRQDESIQNSTGIDLPVTGGIGTILFTVIGLLLMAGAAYFLFFNRKKCK
ncbi:MAG: SpaH/EbpB family LPXTG-anchored major pilin [Clostridia bacterium]|nr:SpaH/EbpB family LPXTG-anchored major pilin [Clostridia bacterium]